MDRQQTQRNLAKAGLYKGSIDGVLGPKTWTAIVAFAAPSRPPDADAITLRGIELAKSGEKRGLTTPERIAGYLSNTAHETGDFRKLRENMGYSAVGLAQTWPGRYAVNPKAAVSQRKPTAKAIDLARQGPVAIANDVYARPLEGNRNPGDGWRYRGGGDIQLTFANAYAALGIAINQPLAAHPELIETPAIALEAGLWYFEKNNLWRFYDAGQPKRARAFANAGDLDYPSPIGWDDVLARYSRLLTVVV